MSKEPFDKNFRKATMRENLMLIRARLSDHLSPAEMRELQEAAVRLQECDEHHAPPSSTPPIAVSGTPRTDKLRKSVVSERVHPAWVQHAEQLERELGLANYAIAFMEACAASAIEEKLDAARYRWLRDVSVPPHNFYLSVPDEFKDVRYTAKKVDAAIDAAIAALNNRSDDTANLSAAQALRDAEKQPTTPHDGDVRCHCPVRCDSTGCNPISCRGTSTPGCQRVNQWPR